MSLDVYNWQAGQILCFVAKSDSVVLEIEVDRNAIGQDILDKVCDSLGTVEKDYFGLQYVTSKRESYWLNLRNRVLGQISGQPPYRLRLRVKYFVQPHLLMQSTTREMFFKQLKNDIFSGKLTVSPDYIPSLGALIAQAEYGDYDSRNFASVYSNLKFGESPLSHTDFLSIGLQHKQLIGMSKSQVVSFFLKEAAKLPSYGTEVYLAKLETREQPDPSFPGNSVPAHISSNVIIRLGPHGLEISEEKTEEITRIPFTAVQLATHTGKMIDIAVLQDDATISTTSFRMSSERSSNAIYRAITEMLAFFTWETVHSSVIHQYSRDFKGHLLALIRPADADTCKQYVFDVQKTWREVHDSVKRTLYKQKVQDENLQQDCQSTCHNSTISLKSCNNEENDEVQYLYERISAIKDALTCKICMDKEINAVFWPCGHQVCCFDCADICQMCPICRQNIDKTQIVYPAITRKLVEGKSDISDSEDEKTASDEEYLPPLTPTSIGENQNLNNQMEIF